MRAHERVQDPGIAREMARADAEMARARAEVARAQQQSAAAQAAEGNTSVTRSADGRTTTIVGADGKRTVIERGADGQVTIRTGDNTVTLPTDPGEAIEKLAEQRAFDAMTGVPAPPVLPHDEIPEQVIPLVGTIFGIIAATIVLFPITRAWARRMDRKTAGPMTTPDTTARLDRIEQAIETMAVEVERVSEAQRYSARLLTERLPDASARAAQTAELAR